MFLPTLYKKTSTGAIQEWKICVIENPDSGSAYNIITEFGQLDGKKQETLDTIFEGKNIGKKNETTPYEQACLEATAKWEKQKKKGYVVTLEDAKNEATDEIIEGGILPMLAHKFRDHSDKIKFPCCVQPKLDGIRCIAIIKNGKCTLWSRTRKPISSVPHIVEELEQFYRNRTIILDGELYNHEFKDNFEHIVHIVRQTKTVDPEHTDVQYHVYDVITNLPFYDDSKNDRCELLAELSEMNYIKVVETKLVNENDLMRCFEVFRKNGYEGAMARNCAAKYENKRSYHLQKIKEFEDDEFEIIAIVEGRGKLQGHAGSFTCITKNGIEFEVKMSGSTDKLKEYFENPSSVIGKLLTVRFQGYTNKNNVPRFPIGISLRDYE